MPALGGPPPRPSPGGSGGPGLGVPPAKRPRQEAFLFDNDSPNVVHLAVLGEVEGVHHGEKLWHCYVYEEPWRGCRYFHAMAGAAPLVVDASDQKAYAYRAEIDVFDDDESDEEETDTPNAGGIIYTSEFVAILNRHATLSWRPHRSVRLRADLVE